MTATITETDLDMKVLERLDFKESLPCEFISRDGLIQCSETALWVLRYGCCVRTILLCSYHKDMAVALATKFKSRLRHNAKGNGCGNELLIKAIDRI